MSNRTRYAAQQPDLSRRGGTATRDSVTRNLTGDEVNEQGYPLGTARRPVPDRPFAQNLTNFQAGGGTPGLDAMKLRNFPGAAAVGAKAPMPVPAKDEFGRINMPTPTPSPTATPARAAAPAGFPALRNPDDRALFNETMARDRAARAPEPISIPGGDPAARAWNAARGTGHTMTPEPGAPARAPIDPTVNPAVVAAAGTGQQLRTPWGMIGSTTAPQRTPAGVTASAQMRHDSPMAAPLAQVAPASAFPSLANAQPLTSVSTDSPTARQAFLDRRAPPAPTIGAISPTPSPISTASNFPMLTQPPATAPSLNSPGGFTLDAGRNPVNPLSPRPLPSVASMSTPNNPARPPSNPIADAAVKNGDDIAELAKWKAGQDAIRSSKLDLIDAGNRSAPLASAFPKPRKPATALFANQDQ